MQCVAKTKSGSQCKNQASSGSTYCRIHATLSNTTTDESGSNGSGPLHYRANGTSAFLYFLLFLQVLVTFSFGILGSTLAEKFDVDPSILIVASVTAISLSFAVTLAVTYVQAGRQLPTALRFKSVKNLLGTIYSTLPVGFIAGVVISSLSMLVTGRGQYFRFSDSRFLPSRFWDYELAIFVITTMLIGLLSARRNDPILTISFASACALAVAGAILLLHSDTNAVAWTVLGWLGVLITFAFLVGQRWIRKGCTHMIQFFSPPPNRE